MIRKYVEVNGRRTSLAIEAELWDALAEIATREGKSLPELLSALDLRREGDTLAGAVRVYVLSYFRAAVEPKAKTRESIAA